MGDAPKLLVRGATFLLDRDFDSATDQGLRLLSKLTSELRRAGHLTTKVRRGKPDDVRCRCDRYDSRIELILVIGTAPRFLLLAFDFSKTSGIAAPSNANETWNEMYGIVDATLGQREFDGTQIHRLTAAEANAHCMVMPPSE